MADTHVKDPSWDTDLLWHYFHDVTTSAPPPLAYGKFYKNQDPLGELSNRHRVYQMLVDEPVNTLPPPPAADAQDPMGNNKKSMIPWNQNNGGFLKSVNNELWCGSIIKIVFVRYMGWKMVEPAAHNFGKDVAGGVKWTIDKLSKNIPVRASLGGTHYVGIVGHRSKDKDNTDFLCIDPWAYGAHGTTPDTIIYAGAETAFLGISKRSGASWTYTEGEIVRWVETPP